MNDDKTGAVQGAPTDSAACGPDCGCVGAEASSDFETRLRAVLDKVRPFLQMDGGDIELIAIEDKNALVRLVGACHGCPSAIYTLKMGVEQAIRREIPDFGELIQVD
jgi:Fe-S cluster biogenesis protein NfuA